MSEGNGYATAAQLIGNSKRRYTETPTPSGLKVRLQSLSEGEMSAVEADKFDYKNGGLNREAVLLGRARLIAACAVDVEGNRIFDESDVEKIAINMDSRDAIAIFRACNEHTGLDEDFEALVKNSSATGDDDSPSS